MNYSVIIYVYLLCLYFELPRPNPAPQAVTTLAVSEWFHFNNCMLMYFINLCITAFIVFYVLCNVFAYPWLQYVNRLFRIRILQYADHFYNCGEWVILVFPISLYSYLSCKRNTVYHWNVFNLLDFILPPKGYVHFCNQYHNIAPICFTDSLA